MEQSDYVTSLQQELARADKDRKALAEELKNTDSVVSSTTAVKTALLPQVPGYIRNIQDLAETSDSDSVRLAANKLLIEWAVTNKLDANNLDADDDFKKLLESIKKVAK